MFDGKLLQLSDKIAILEFSLMEYMEWKLDIITNPRRAMLPFNALSLLAP
jgi:hypothetical protein